MIGTVRIVFSIVLAACLCGLGISTATSASARSASPQVSAPEAIVIDGWNGNVLYAKSADVERYPASTVKIMTALVVLQSGVPMNRIVTVSPYAAEIGGSTAGLWTGERISIGNLMHGMLMPSGNDAAIALSEAVGGTEQRFVNLMNAEATRLHLFRTRYLSPNGFDMVGQVTTARDLANLTRVAMQQHQFARIVRTRAWTVRSAGGAVLHHWTNLNHLLWRSTSIDGVKTGTTLGAGACLVSSERLHGKWVIEVNLGSLETTRFSDGLSLLSYGLAQAMPVPPAR